MTPPNESFINRLAGIRERRGLSASALAGLAGATRQTIYAIEAGHYMPNTALSLRLARALDVTVEEIFQLEAENAAAVPLVPVQPLFDDEPLRPGQSVRLCRVGGATVAVPCDPVPIYLPIADAVVAPPQSRRVRQSVVVPVGSGDAADRLLIAGCDPALSILAAHAARAGVDVALAGCNSSKALGLLRNERVHIAGTHLYDARRGEANLAAVHRHFEAGSVRVITFASWQQGYVVAAGNPKQIHSAADLARPGVRIVNREAGSGSRVLLDHELKKAGLVSSQIAGYGDVATGHLPAAWHITSGSADCCIATQSAARAFSLAFIPIRSERFDLVVPAASMDQRDVQRLLDSMQRLAFRNELSLLGEYDTAETGKLVDC